MDQAIENKEIGRLLREAQAEQAAQDQLDEEISTAAGDSEGVGEDNARPEIPEEQLNEMMRGGLSLASQLIGGIVAPNWNIQPEEHSMLAGECVSVLDYYFPNAKNYVGPWAGLGLAVASIAYPRVAEGVPMRLPKPEEEEATAQQGEESPKQQAETEAELNPLLDPNSERLH